MQKKIILKYVVTRYSWLHVYPHLEEPFPQCTQHVCLLMYIKGSTAIYISGWPDCDTRGKQYNKEIYGPLASWEDRARARSFGCSEENMADQ